VRLAVILVEHNVDPGIFTIAGWR